MGQAVGCDSQLLSDDTLLSFARWSRLVEMGLSFLANRFVNSIRNLDFDCFNSS